MSDRLVRSAAAFAIALACALPAVRVAGQAQTLAKTPSQLGEAAELLKKASADAAAKKNYKTPRTAWGEPDLQGVWSYATTTPLSKPDSAGDKTFLTDEEVADLAERTARSRMLRQEPGDPGTYNNFWWDRGESTRPHVADCRSAGRQTSPADAGRKKARAARSRTSANTRPTRISIARRPIAASCTTACRRCRPATTTRIRSSRRRAGRDPRREHPSRAHRSRSTADRTSPTTAPLERRLARPLGRRHARRRDDELQRQDAAAIRRLGEHCAVERFTRVSADLIDYQYTITDPHRVHAAVHGLAADAARDDQHFRVRVPRGQPRHGRHPGRRARRREKSEGRRGAPRQR